MGCAMKKSIKKFVSREFVKTVDLELLRRLIDKFDAAEQLGWENLPEEDRERREAIYELFRGADETFPKKLLDALHRIMMLSNPTGVRLLHERAEAAGIKLIPDEELEDENDGRHLTPRHIALRAFLDHQEIFDQTRKVAAFFFGSKILEFHGTPDTPSRHDSAEAREAFQKAASAYFSERYQGRYCRISWYDEGEEIRIMVAHGHNATMANVEEDGEEQTRAWREIGEDSIRYHAPSGWAGVMARTLGDQRQPDPGVARRGFDDGPARFELTAGLGGLDHLGRDPVLGATARVQVLDLGRNQARPLRHHRVQLDEGRVTDELTDMSGDPHDIHRVRRCKR